MQNHSHSKDIKRKRLYSLGLFLAPVIFLVLVFFSCFVHEWKLKEIGYTGVLGFAGVVLGSGIGFLIAPETIRENRNVRSKISVPVMAFLGGYLFSRFEPTILFILKDEMLIAKPEVGIRFLIFVICLVISTIHMYVYRSYLDDFARLMEYQPANSETANQQTVSQENH